MSPENDIDSATLKTMAAARTVAVITGAGISSESGIPTFRGAGGLWNNTRAEELATPQAFERDPELVWRWYEWRRGICAEANPNPAHLIVAEMEKRYPDFLLITQNVDGLHGRSGVRRLREIHGNIWKARCTVCRTVFELPEHPLPEIPVKCVACNGLARPHIVWFGENYDPDILREALEFLRRTELLFVIGTSGMVSLPVYLTEEAVRNGSHVIEINPNPTEISRQAHQAIRGKAGEVLPAIWERMLRAGG